ncbi:NAD-dependent epimerase/dehydratase family protein [Sphingomonas sanxanigenens]|uniref:NAD(P)-binding domain-containing protein n=1 Tax=Sphingomonas sanxanigenens DSM 19645 = NX02 TaxID=1123269 RepID=W0ALC4_9SPHN|nr:NAD(P)H-binding protein [Sphingomonas sanxanigenens]AHE57098.1 hypothetical protein NX02_27570 [Sphingomonas sanxanigenens DSM 19645 = NX02]
MSVLALTGATGFVGRTVLRMAVAGGHHVRALTRRPQPDTAGVTWIAGALDRPASLAELARGADAVIHVAGVVNAPDRAGFAAGNIEGTRAMVRAAKDEGVTRFIHVSSLSAREPALSIYGWSKAGAEDAVADSGLDWSMVRPPAIYGPGDTEMLDLFRMARRGVIMLPPRGRFSVVAVEDLARLLLTLATARAGTGQIYEVDDGVAGGWTHEGFAQAIGAAVGRRVRAIHTPRPLLRVASAIDRATRRTRAKLTGDRVGYLCHPDWVSTAIRQPPANLWRAETDTRDGLKATADWYRAEGWLR